MKFKSQMQSNRDNVYDSTNVKQSLNAHEDWGCAFG